MRGKLEPVGRLGSAERFRHLVQVKSRQRKLSERRGMQKSKLIEYLVFQVCFFATLLFNRLRYQIFESGAVFRRPASFEPVDAGSEQSKNSFLKRDLLLLPPAAAAAVNEKETVQA